MSEAIVTVPIVLTVKLNAEHTEITEQQMREAILKNPQQVAAGVASAVALSSYVVEAGWVDENTSFGVTDILEVDTLPIKSTSEGSGDIVFYS